MPESDIKRRVYLIKSAVWSSITVALFLMVMKLIVCLGTGSLTLKATLIDSILDLLAAFTNIIIVKIAYKPSNKRYQFGYYKAEAIGSLLQSLLVLLTAAFIIFEAIISLVYPQAPVHVSLNEIYIMVIGLVLAFILILYQRFVIKMTDSTLIKADEIHYRGDFLLYVLSLAVLICLFNFNCHYIDAIGSVIIACYLAKSALKVLFEAMTILLDRALPEAYQKKIVNMLKEIPDFNYLEMKSRSSSGKIYIYIKLNDNNNSLMAQIKAVIAKSTNKETEVIFTL